MSEQEPTGEPVAGEWFTYEFVGEQAYIYDNGKEPEYDEYMLGDHADAEAVESLTALLNALEAGRAADKARIEALEVALIDLCVPRSQDSVVVVCGQCGAVGKTEARREIDWHRNGCPFVAALTTSAPEQAPS